MSKPKLITIFLIVVFLAVATYFLLIPGVKEEKPKVYHVGILSGLDFFADLINDFKEEMTRLGYVEGENIVYDIYKAPAPVGNEEAVRSFIDNKVDLIFVFPTEASLEAKAIAEGTGIPVVFTSALVEGIGLIESVRVPGGNITGVRYPTTESAIGRLEFLNEVAPNVKKVWIPYLKGYPTVTPQLEAMEPVASSLNMTLIPGPFSSSAEVKTYLDTLSVSTDIGMDAILMLAEPFSVTPEVTETVFKFADEHKLPVSSALVMEEDYGPIVGFHPENAKMGKLAAPLVDKVLQGLPAGTIPVVTADNDLRINLKVAQKIGLTVPEGLLTIAIKIVR